MTSHKQYQRQGFLSLLQMAFHMKYWILATVAVLVLSAFIALRFIPKQYERIAVLKVDMSAYDGLKDSLPDAQGNTVEFVRDRMEAKVMLLQSQPVVQQALQLQSQRHGGQQPESVELYSHNKPNLTVNYSKYSDVLHVSMRAEDKAKADEFLLCLIDSYNDQVAQEEAYGHAYIMVIDPPHGSDKPVYPHAKMWYLLAVVLGLVLPITFGELKEKLSEKNKNRYYIH